MYILLEEAKEEVWKRWNNADLRRRVLEYVGELPDGYGAEPCAVLSRHVATPNFEAHRFHDIAHPTGLQMMCDVYPADKFCTKNPDKYWLGKMAFHSGKGKNNGDRLTNVKLVLFHTEDGKVFSDMATLWGDDFVSFHQRLFGYYFPDIRCIDNSDWTRNAGTSLLDYYRRFLAIFVCHGILFENFLTEHDDEGTLTQNVVGPAFRHITEFFGYKPLIVRLRLQENDASPYWSWYPSEIEGIVRHLVIRKTSCSVETGRDQDSTCMYNREGEKPCLPLAG